MKKSKIILGSVLVIFITLLLAVSVFFSLDDNSQVKKNIISTVKHMTGTVVNSGTNGTVSWTLYDDGELVIRAQSGGSGQFNDWGTDESQAPFASINKSAVQKVTFENTIYANGTTHALFKGMKNLTEIENLTYLKTSSAINTAQMFYRCEKLEDLDLTSFETSNVLDMEYMFAYCFNLKSIEWNKTKFDTSSVQNMNRMFVQCQDLEFDEHAFSGFNTSSVIGMSGMFEHCHSIRKLDLTSFNTTNVTAMNSMFWACYNLDVNLRSFDTTAARAAGGTTNSMLCDVKNFELGENTIFDMTRFGSLPRGTFKKDNDITYSTAQIYHLMDTLDHTGRYVKVSNISKNMTVDFPVNYKILDQNVIDDFKVYESDGTESQNPIFKKRGGVIYMDLGNISTISQNPTYTQKAVITLKDKAVDSNGNTYDVRMTISDVELRDMVAQNMNYQKEILIIGGSTIELSNSSYSDINSQIGRSDHQFCNGGLEGISENVKLEIIKSDGTAAPSGSYIFSAYDVDIASPRDPGGYGYNSEGVNLGSGMDTSTVKFSQDTFLQTIDWGSLNRITGTRDDTGSELSEFLVKANAQSSEFTWTAGYNCGTDILTNYQPKKVNFAKIDDLGNSLAGADFDLYYANDNENPVAQWTSSHQMDSLFLNPGQYRLVEVGTQNGYFESEEIIFYVDTNDNLRINGDLVDNSEYKYDGNDIDNDTIVIVNQRINKNIVINKVDEQGNKLEGADFNIQYENVSDELDPNIQTMNKYPDDAEYYMEKVDGIYRSNNKERSGTTAVSYSIIDLSHTYDSFHYTVTASIDSEEGHDWGYVALVKPYYESASGTGIDYTDSVNNEITYILRISGNVEEATGEITLEGGECYTIFYVYAKDSQRSVGNDRFIINKTNLNPISCQLNRTTNANGVISVSQNEFNAPVEVKDGYVTVTETNAPDHYYIDANDASQTLKFDTDLEFTFVNKRKPQVIVHHYLKESDGTYTTNKVAADDELEGMPGDSYTTSAKTNLTGLDREKSGGSYVTPSNATGNYADGITEVNYYYEVNPIILTINHVMDGTQNAIVPQETITTYPTVTFPTDGTYTINTNLSYDLDANNNYSTLTNGVYDFVSVKRGATALDINNDLTYSTDTEITYSYQYSNYNYTVEYYYDGVIDPTKTDVLSAPYNSQITTYTDKNIVGHRLDTTSGLPLTITDVAENNVIKIYYVRDNYNYTVEYYYDGVLDSSKTDTISALFGSEITTYTDKCTSGYRFDSDDNVPLIVTENANINVIKVYYVTIPNLSYVVNYLEQGTNNVIATQKVVTSVSAGDVINSADEIISIYGYDYDSADKVSLTISTTIADNYINLYYTKKDTSVLVKHLEQGTDTPLANDVIITGKVGDTYTTTKSSDVPSKYEVVSDTPTDYTGTMTEAQIVVTYYYTKKATSVLVHHYIQEKDGTKTQVRVPSNIEGERVQDVTINGHVDDPYTTSAASNIASIYELVEVPQDATGTMTEAQIVLNYYYQLKDYGYTVEYYYDNVKDDSKTVTGTATYGDLINTYTDKNIAGYKLDTTTGLPLTISDDTSTNVIKIYYVKDNFGYTIEYYYDNVKDDSKTEIGTAEYQSQITSYPDKNIDGYRLDTTSGLPLTITEDSTANIIKVYYVKRTDLSYIVNYLEKGTDNVISTQKFADNVTYGDTINSADEVIAITGYNYDSADKASITISHTVSENVINLYYTKKDVKVTTRYLEETTENVLANPVENTYKYGDSYTTSPSSDVPSKYELVATPSNATGTLGEQDVVVTYYYRVKDASVLVHHYIKDKSGAYTTNRVPSDVEGVEVADVTINGKVDQAYTANVAGNISSIYELAETPSNATGTMTETQIVVNFYYQLKDYNYTVEYYYDNVKDDNKTDTGTATYGDVINNYTDKNITGYKLDTTSGLPLTITDNESTNVIKVYYVKDNFGYTIEYYYDNVKDNSKTETGTAEYQSQITTYPDKNIDGYRLDTTSGLPLTITEDPTANIIKVYYVKRTDLSYIVNYLEKGTDNVVSPQKEVTSVTYGDTILSADEVITITGYNYDSADKASITISHTVSENVINLYYTKKDVKVTTRYLEETTENVLANPVENTYKYGDSYTTSPSSDVPSKYELVATPSNATGTLGEQDVVVTYYYRVKDASVLVHHYIKDKSGAYTTNRVPSNVEGVDVSDVTINGKVDDSYQTSAASNVSSIYELVETPANATGTMTETQIVVNYYYQLKDYGYTVEYYYDNVKDDSKTVTGTATYGDVISTYTDKNITGYKLDTTTGLPLTITDNASTNVIKVYYVKDNFGYTIEYYYDNVKDDTKTENGTAEYQSQITTYPDKNIDGYRLDTTSGLPLTITEDPTANIIKVYYVKRTDLSYIVNYLEKGTDNVVGPQKEVTSVTYGDTINAADEVISIYGYDYDSADKASITISHTVSENVINLYYTKKDAKVTARYLEQGTDFVLANPIVQNGKVGDSYTTEVSQDVPSKYELVATPSNATGTMTEQDIEVIYYFTVKDASVLVHHYIKDKTGAYTTNRVPSDVEGVEVADVTINGKVDQAYTANAAGNISSIYELAETPANATGTMTESQIVVNFYYQLKDYGYTVEYYYDNVKDDTKTETGTATYGDVINNYTDKNITGYKLDSTSGLPLTITDNESTNVIKVYYVKDSFGYTIEYYYDNVKDDNKTETGTAEYQSQITSYPDKNIDGYRLDTTSGLPLTITEDPTANIIKVYYVKRTDLSYIVNYLEKGTDNAISTQKFADNVTYGDTINSADEVIAITGYNYDSADKASITISHTVSENVINLYYTKKDVKVTTRYLEETTENVLANPVENTYKYGDSYTTSPSLDVPSKYELVATPSNATGTLGEQDVVVTYYYRLKDASVLVHHYIKDKSGTYTQNRVPSNVEGETVSDVTINGKVDQAYQTTAASNVSNIYELVETPSNATGTMTETQIVVNYYYQLKDYDYSIEYYYDGVKDNNETISGTATYGDVINTYTDKNRTGYKLNTTSGLPLTITENESTNVIKIYYVKDNFGYTVEYYYDNVKDDSKTETGTAEYQSQITTYVDKNINGYRFDSVDGLPLTITEDPTANIIKVYYVKRADLSYIVNYLEKDTDNVISDQKYVENVTYGNTITSANEVITITGYNYDSADKESITISNTVSENVINLYYTKKDTKVIVKHLEENTENELAQEVTINGKFGDSYTTTKSSDVPSKYEVVSETPAGYTGTMTEQDIVVTYYYRVKDTEVIVHHYIMDKEGNKTTNRVPSNVEGVEVADVTISGKVDQAYQTSAAGNIASIYELAETPENATGTMTEAQIEVNYYYQLKDYGYTVEYYYDGDIDLTKTENGTATYGDIISTYTDKNVPGYKLDSTSGLPLTITDNTETNVIKIYYVRDNFEYKVEYYYGNVKDENATESGTALYGSEINTYIDKPKEGYVFDKVEELPLVITEDPEVNVLKVYYKNMENLVYTVNYLEKGTGRVIKTAKITGNVSYNDIIRAVDEIIPIYGYEYDSADKESITITVNESENVINLYYTHKDGKVTVRHLEDGTDNVLAPEEEITGKVGDEYTTNPSSEVPAKYEVVSSTPDDYRGEIAEDEIVVTYHYVLRDIPVTVHYYIEDNDGNKTTNKVPLNNGETATDIEWIKKPGEKYTSNALTNPSDKYELVEIPENQNGTVPDTGSVEVIYYYKLKPAVVTTHHFIQDEGGNFTTDRVPSNVEGEEVQDVVINGRVDDTYETSAATNISNKYELVSIPSNATGTMTVENIEVNYYYALKNSRVTAKYIDIATNTPVSDEEVLNGKVDSSYVTDQKDVEGYTFIRSTDNTSGKMTVEDIVVTYYYAKNTNVIVKYLEKGTDDVLADEVNISGYEGKEYTTEQKVIENYECVEIDGSAEGTMRRETTEVIYYYKHKATARVEYIDRTNNVVMEWREQTGLVGDEFVTEPKEFENYILVETPEETTVIMTKEPITLKYYYELEAAPEEARIIERHINVVTGAIIESIVHTDKHVGDTYKIDPKTFEGYELVTTYKGIDYTPTNAEGTATAETIVVDYYYIRPASITVHYVDKATGEKLVQDIIINGHESDPYETEAKVFEGYILDSVEGDTEGTLSPTASEVTYKYNKASVVTVNHINDVTGEVLYTETLTGYEGENYATSSKEIANYDVVTEKLPANATGKYTREAQVVNYYYKAKITVITEFINGTTGIRVALEERQTGHEGDNYTTVAKTISGYDMVQVIGEKTGVMKPVKHKDGSISYEIRVIYVYRVPITVVVDYIDKETGKKIDTSKTITGYEGDIYTTSGKEIDGYELIEEPDNANGLMEIKVVDNKEVTEIHVKYIYAKKASGKLPQTSEDYGNKGLFIAAFLSNIALAGVIFKKLFKEDQNNK